MKRDATSPFAFGLVRTIKLPEGHSDLSLPIISDFLPSQRWIAKFVMILWMLFNRKCPLNTTARFSQSCREVFNHVILRHFRPKSISVLLLVKEIYLYWLSIYYSTFNEICANKPHRLRRSEAMGGMGGQTILWCHKLSSTHICPSPNGEGYTLYYIYFS